ncbi:uncharacterized protein LOC134255463, partial [Saccostrea cucullata]|uniref:uncharacterized protein LOC134255463 n=1 Tax=Saccostrea cuccullata TaxID=36930 RepID=UPI002ED34855
MESKEVSTSQTIISQDHTIQVQEGIHLVPVLVPSVTILGIISGIATIMWKRKRCKTFFRRKHSGNNDNVNIFEKESLLNTSNEYGGEMLPLHNVNQEHTNRKRKITMSDEHVGLENDPDISENWNANKEITITTDKYHQDDAMYNKYIHEEGLKEQKKKDYGFLQYKRRQDFALNLCKTSYLQ